MIKKYIAVTMRYDYFYGKKEIRNGINFDLINWIYQLGFYPHLIPNDLRYFNEIKKNNFSGFILSGGNDTNLKMTRSILENKILSFSKKEKLPVLGICHGMQMMNKYEGGNLKKVKNHVGIYHKLKSIIKNYPNKVNSFHNYSISKLGKDFEVISESHDGEIEAIRHMSYKWLGIMWHPEREKKFDAKIIKIVKKLFSEGK